MSPRQSVVVENSALRRFMKRYGYCVSAGGIAGAVEEAMKEDRQLKEGQRDIYGTSLRVTIKKRNDQWFVTDIEKVEE